ncbi:hypothetical protein R3W88_009276 [Solanum pinnatisectum]|nr:hypothetical protein R3W88_009276 [Solanum pinnatisectum]
MVVDMVRNGQASNLKIKGVVEDILQVVAKMNYEVNHCHREANQVADTLAKHVVIYNEAHMYHEWRDIPKLTVGSYQLDKMQMPSIRIGYDKPNFFVSWGLFCWLPKDLFVRGLAHMHSSDRINNSQLNECN